MSDDLPPLEDRLARIAAMIGDRPAPVRVVADPEVEAWRRSAVQARADEAWRSTIPVRFADAALDGLAAEVAEPLRAWTGLPSPRPNVLLAGPVGVGKTWAACATVRPLIAAGEGVLFAPLVELFDWMRPSSGVESRWYEAATVDVLVLDDLGTERGTDWTAERLYGLVNRRWSDCRPVVATTNMRAGDLGAALGERTYSRLVGGALIVRLTGEDRRRVTGVRLESDSTPKEDQ